MSKFQLARKYSTEKIIAKAFKEYTESVANSYNEMMSSMADVINLEIDDVSTSRSVDINMIIDNEISKIMSNNKISDNDCIVLSDGVYNVKELYTSIGLASYDNDHQDKVTNETPVSISQVNGKISTMYTNIEDLLTDVNSTYHATICTAGVAQAYALGDTISDQVQLARDYVGQKFSSAYSDVSGYLEDSINSIKNGAGVVEWITGLLKTSGIDDASQFDDYTFQNSESYMYTGASPAGALCWDTFKDKAISTVKVAASAVKGIIGGIVSLGSKLFTKAKNKFYQVVVNPYDLEEINKNSDGHTIDGYADQKSFEYDFRLDDIPFGSRYAGFQHLKSYEANKYIHTDYFCCETMSGFIMNDAYNGGFAYPAKLDESLNILNNCKSIYNSLHPDSVVIPNDISSLLYEFQGANIREKLLNAILMMTPSLSSGLNYQLYIWCCQKVKNNSLYIDILKKDWSIRSDSKFTIFDLSVIAVNSSYIYSKSSIPKAINIIRYKPVNYRLFGKMMRDIPCQIVDGSSYQFSTADIISAFNHIVDSGDIYADCSDNERVLYNSFVLGFKISRLLLSLLNYEAEADINGGEIPTKIGYTEYYVYNEAHGNNVQFFGNYSVTPFEESPVLVDFTNTPDLQFCNVIPIYSSDIAITNKDFFYVAIGTGYGLEYQPTINYWNTMPTGADIAYKNFKLFNLLKEYKDNNPTSYEFWPYEKNNSCWNDAQFRIKSDSENIKSLQRFVSAAAIIVASVVIGVVAKKVIRKMLNKAYIKQQVSQSNAVQAAREGTLTGKDLKAYNKSTKRLNKLNKLFGNTTTVASSTNSSILSDISATIQANDSPARDNEIISLEEGINNQVLLTQDSIQKLIVGY